MIKLLYVEVKDYAASLQVEKQLELLGYHFVTQAPVAGTLDNILELIKESYEPAIGLKRV